MSPETTRRQERGLRRIEEILDAADTVFADQGYDAATTNSIAAAAGISPGSLYQYFDNKQSIATALAQRYLDLLGQLEDPFDPALATLPLDQMVDRAVDAMLAFNLAHPGAKVLLSGAHTSPELAQAITDLHDVLCGGVESLIERRTPRLPAADRTLAAEVTISIYSALLPSIVDAGTRQRPRHVRELKAAIVGYWATLDR